MTAHVDAVRGTPIMDLATFETFIAYALGEPLDSAQTERLDRLREAGIVPEDETDPIVPEIAEAVRAPSVRVSLSVDGVVSLGWVRDMAVVLRPLDHDTDDVEVLAAGPMFLPMLVAMAVGLGPRPFDGDAPVIEGSYELLDDLGNSHARVDRVYGGGSSDVEDVLRTLSASYRSRWLAATRWVAHPGQEAGRGLEVVDSDSGMYQVVDADEGGAALVPVSATDVWISLTQLTPEAHEADLDATVPDEGERLRW